MREFLVIIGVGGTAGIICSTFAPADLTHIAVFIIGAFTMAACESLDRLLGNA